MKHQWKDLFFEEFFTMTTVFTAVDEDVELSRVGMEIAVKHHTTLFHQPDDMAHNSGK